MATEDPAVSNFREYLRIKSVQPNPDYDGCIKFLERNAKEIGLEFKSFDVKPGKPVAILTLRGRNDSLPTLLLSSHMDVVPVYSQHWTFEPFSAHKDSEGNIYARGAQDMKSVGIQYLEAIRRLQQSGNAGFLRTIHLLYTSDEEIGSVGMGAFVKHPEFVKLNLGFSLDEGIASDNDHFLVFYAERNVWPIKVTCPGNPGHGSKFIQDTAAEKIRHVINRFLDFREQQRQKLLSNPELNTGDMVTLNLTKIEGGVQLNVVPSEFTAYFDIRVPPTENFEKLEAKLRGICAEVGPEVKLEFIRQFFVQNVTKTDSENPWWVAFASTMEKLNLKYKKEIFIGATDSRHTRDLGIPVLGFSPMNNTPQLLHEHNEFLNEKTFLDGIQIYMHLIPALANIFAF